MHKIFYYITRSIRIKQEFIIFGNSNPQDETTLKVGDKLISSKAEIKYLGVYIDKDFKYQNQVKILLSKMAQGIKCIYALRAGT